VGSVLTEVNGKRVEGDSYVATVASLKNWQPPLQLRFRSAPTCGGFLRELTPSSNKWKIRYCYVNGGVISVYSVEELQKKAKNDKKAASDKKAKAARVASAKKAKLNGGWTSARIVTQRSTAPEEDDEDEKLLSGAGKPKNLSAGQASARAMYQPVQVIDPRATYTSSCTLTPSYAFTTPR
jgi:hypothetical protein